MVDSTTPWIILRHDVDRIPANAIRMSAIETGLGIRASYHFRYPKGGLYEESIKTIAARGHEIAYHYEELEVIFKSMNNFKKRIQLRFSGKDFLNEGIIREYYDQAWRLFEERLGQMRNYYPVKIISMHGSPFSPFDNREVWKHKGYSDLGIVCEAYHDINYSEVLYLTDTGRQWNCDKYNLRDKPVHESTLTQDSYLNLRYRFDSTDSIITALREGKLPSKVIISTHPQRWNNNPLRWMIELSGQGVRNIVKSKLIKPT